MKLSFPCLYDFRICHCLVTTDCVKLLQKWFNRLHKLSLTNNNKWVNNLLLKKLACVLDSRNWREPIGVFQEDAVRINYEDYRQYLVKLPLIDRNVPAMRFRRDINVGRTNRRQQRVNNRWLINDFVSKLGFISFLSILILSFEGNKRIKLIELSKIISIFMMLYLTKTGQLRTLIL